VQFALKVAILECSFINHSQGILGVNHQGFGHLGNTRLRKLKLIIVMNPIYPYT
jgi:hypothetical protein